MKILHCSDLHFGQTFFGYDRSDEHRHLLDFIADTVASEKPDILIIAGDIFDGPQPSASLQRLTVEGMLRIKNANPDMRLIAIAGNHDSGAGHEAHKALWSAVGCDMIGSIHKNADIKDYIIKISNVGSICALPFSSPRNMPDNVFRRLYEAADEVTDEHLPIILTAHLTVSDCDFSGHDISIGGVDAVNADALLDEFDYVALGHIHRPQTLTSARRVRYSGAPVAVSFDERYPHSISLVTIDSRSASPVIEEIPIEPLHPLVSLPSHHLSPADAMAALEDFEADKCCYIRLMVKTDSYLPAGLIERAREICKAKQQRFCLVHTSAERSKEKSERSSMSVTEFLESTPLSIAKRYFDDKGLSFDSDLETLFDEIAGNK